jgi:uncharacterized protein
MNRSRKLTLLLGALLLCSLIATGGAWAQTPAPVPDDAITSMSKAMPKRAVVKPVKARKLLVFNLCRGFVHGAVPYGAKALELMGKQTGAFETTITEDISFFEPAKLNQFDAVCMNNTTGEVFMPPTDAFAKMTPAEQQAATKRSDELKKSLLDFVKGGKGIIGIHAATDCLYQWPEYGEMMGGYFDGHPWAWNTVEYIKVDDPKHRLNRPFRGVQSFKVSDEIYQIRDPYSRQNLRVLLTLDTAKTDMETNKKDMHRADKDFAVSWIRSYGQGRVFYCSLGHNYEIFWTPAILRFDLGGIQFALGDLKVDTTPSAKVVKK